MRAEKIKPLLARKVRRVWPWAEKASDLPFPDYWKKQTEWLTFHAPHLGDQLVEQFVEDMIEIARDAESRGVKPEPWIVSEKVKAIWANVDKAKQSSTIGTGETKADEKREAWDHAAERAAEVRQRMAQRGTRQRSLL